MSACEWNKYYVNSPEFQQIGIYFLFPKNGSRKKDEGIARLYMDFELNIRYRAAEIQTRPFQKQHSFFSSITCVLEPLSSVNSHTWRSCWHRIWVPWGHRLWQMTSTHSMLRLWRWNRHCMSHASHHRREPSVPQEQLCKLSHVRIMWLFNKRSGDCNHTHLHWVVVVRAVLFCRALPAPDIHHATPSYSP